MSPAREDRRQSTAAIEDAAMRYVVTGATGFVGGRVAMQLHEAGHDVVALVRDPSRAELLAAQEIELARGDVVDTAAVTAALAGADGLFHVAGWYKVGTRDKAEGWRVNVDGTQSALTAARAAGVAKVVYTSTLAVNSDTSGRVLDEQFRFTGQHLSTYDETKAVAHTVVEEAVAAGQPVVTVMPGLVYGPGDTSQTGELLRSVIHNRPVVIPRGARLCWGYVDDIARGHVLAMERGVAGEAYMLAGPPCALDEALRLAAGIAGTRPPRTIPAGVVRGAASLAALVERVVPLPALYTGEALRAGTATYLGSPAKAERELGWSARPLVDGLREVVRAELGSVG
jgi:nucleoside-diphosphate-sugar epimerase